MEELTNLLTKIELAADDIIDSRQQIINLEAKRLKTQEALSILKQSKETNPRSVKNNWVCLGDMFIRLDYNNARNLIFDDNYHIANGVEKLRDNLSNKVNKLRDLEGKPALTAFNLKPLDRKEVLVLRTAFKI